jgi:fatty-acyl-CoA synthase
LLGTNDVVKSGDECISSIEVENIARAHPAIKEAAVVAKPDQHWGERPVLVVPKTGHSFTATIWSKLYTGWISKWSIPDDAIIIDKFPHTGTGKLLNT